MIYEHGRKVVIIGGEEEIPAVVNTYCLNADQKSVEFYELIVGQNRLQHICAQNVLPAKEPGFYVRGLVFVIDEHREAVEGEIVTLGTGPKNEQFFELSMKIPEGGAIRRWYRADEVFVMSNPE